MGLTKHQASTQRLVRPVRGAWCGLRSESPRGAMPMKNCSMIHLRHLKKKKLTQNLCMMSHCRWAKVRIFTSKNNEKRRYTEKIDEERHHYQAPPKCSQERAGSACRSFQIAVRSEGHVAGSDSLPYRSWRWRHWIRKGRNWSRFEVFTISSWVRSRKSRNDRSMSTEGWKNTRDCLEIKEKLRTVRHTWSGPMSFVSFSAQGAPGVARGRCYDVMKYFDNGHKLSNRRYW